MSIIVTQYQLDNLKKLRAFADTIEADRFDGERFSGHSKNRKGCLIHWAYHHSSDDILPVAVSNFIFDNVVTDCTGLAIFEKLIKTGILDDEFGSGAGSLFLNADSEYNKFIEAFDKFIAMCVVVNPPTLVMHYDDEEGNPVRITRMADGRHLVERRMVLDDANLAALLKGKSIQVTHE